MISRASRIPSLFLSSLQESLRSLGPSSSRSLSRPRSLELARGSRTSLGGSFNALERESLVESLELGNVLDAETEEAVVTATDESLFSLSSVVEEI